MAWVAPGTLLVCSKLLEGGAEASYAPLCMLTWSGGADPAEGTLALSGARCAAALAGRRR